LSFKEDRRTVFDIVQEQPRIIQGDPIGQIARVKFGKATLKNKPLNNPSQ
jgi:hypothetical protein